MNFKKILYEQLSKDYCTSIKDIESDKNLFTHFTAHRERRIYEWDDALLKICAVNNKFIMSSSDENLLFILEKEFKDENAGFIGRYDNLKRINKILLEFNEEISDCHHYYIPCSNVVIEKDIKIKWFEKEALFEFYNNENFKNALEFSTLRPDMLAVCSCENGEITGMAAASCDSKTMWQIGINVNENARGKGIGAYLVNLLKDEIIKRGILPFYGTVESHIFSQRIALKCGFTPMWWQLYTKSKNI